MLDYFNLPKNSVADIQEFKGNSVVAGVTWQTWTKPRGVTMCHIFLLGQGGGGGTGVIGANSVSAGGGGGGSGGQTSVTIPAFMLPDTLFISTGATASGNGAASYVSISPNTTANHTVAIANGGGGGGNASAGTGGAAGSAGSIATVGTMPLGWSFANLALAGQAGIIGGAAVAGGALTLPVTGLLVTGGTGGGGLPAAAAAGTNGGAFTVPAAPSQFPPQIGGQGSATATNPADNGSNGWTGMNKLLYSYGGTGGASTHGTATGGGLVQSSGGVGGYGCGSGGMGGALTGSAAGIVSRGGLGYCLIICW